MGVIMHSAKGTTWGKHRYIRKEVGKNGKWRYIYPSTSGKKLSKYQQDSINRAVSGSAKVIGDTAEKMIKARQSESSILMDKLGYAGSRAIRNVFNDERIKKMYEKKEQNEEAAKGPTVTYIDAVSIQKRSDGGYTFVYKADSATKVKAKNIANIGANAISKALSIAKLKGAKINKK